MSTLLPSLTSHLEQHRLSVDLIELIATLASCCTDIAYKLRQAALIGALGNSDAVNVQGEQQKKMDVISNDLLKACLLALPQVKGIASEEEDMPVAGHMDGSYYVLFDPLDGSSNLDINVSVGTIFSILESTSEVENPQLKTPYLLPGKSQKVAGYFLYGSSTQLVLTFGQGTHQFTLNPETHTFELTREHIQIPSHTQEFAINMSNQRFWEPPVQSYVQDLLQGEQGPIGKRFNMRWIASMVAEVHRILTRGGIFMYPRDSRTPDQLGKLRLMYEGNPMAMIVEQAGGRCSDAYMDVMKIKPKEIHERVAIFLGSKEEVDRAESYH